MTDIAQLRALLAKMTRAPYELRGPTYIYGNLQNDMNHTGDRVATTVTASDAAGIVALVNAAEPMLDELERLRAEVARLQHELGIAKAPKCFSCGAAVTEECPRSRGTPCGRAHLGGTRAALGEQP